MGPEAGEMGAFSKGTSSHHKSSLGLSRSDGSGNQTVVYTGMTAFPLLAWEPGETCGCVVS